MLNVSIYYSVIKGKIYWYKKFLIQISLKFSKTSKQIVFFNVFFIHVFLSLTIFV